MGMYKKIFVNQCGYIPELEKKATFVSEKEVEFSVLRSDGTCIFQGKSSVPAYNEASKETECTGDFSEVREVGRYYVTVQGLGESDIFEIGEKVYDDIFRKSVYFFYLQRCGQELTKQAAGVFAHGACHTGDAVIYGSDGVKEVRGGWHDAGDYGRYIVPGAMAVAQLLMAYESNGRLAALYENPYDTQAGSLPYMLSEIKYELAWMMKMQREDGALYHKATCRDFCGFIMPDEEKDELVLSPVSAAATADFAAVTAMAVRFYEKYDSAYAKKLEEASKKAYEALKTMDMPEGFLNPEGIVTGEYADACDEDERYWAAAELYRAFGDKQYRADFETMAEKKIYHGYGWTDMGSYGNRAYLKTEYPVSENIKAAVENSMKELAKKRLEVVEADGFETALSKDEYTWGSNLDTLNNGIHLCDGYRLTGDERYLSAARAQLHYIMGRNPMGVCYVTGFGTNPVKRPHHRPSGFVGKAMPGMLSGGPCSWIGDETAKQVLTADTAAAKCFVDMTGSYSTNEVTIYWNSALVLLMAETLQ